MPRNPTTGVYTRPVNSFAQPVLGETIDPTDADSLWDAYDDALSDSLSRTGLGTMQADLDMGGFNVINTSIGALGTMAAQNANAVAITGGAIGGMPNPSAADDVANKAYVDAHASGLIIFPACRLASAAVLPNTPSYSNGASGVGATLTAGGNSTLTVDGTVAALTDSVLVKNQVSAFQNGVYTVTTAGDGSTPWVLTRRTDFDQAAEMLAGSYFLVTAGSTNINNAYTLAANVTTVGTTAATFNLFASQPAQQWTGSGSDIYRPSDKVGVGAVPVYQFYVRGAGQTTAALTDAGNKNGMIAAQDSGAAAGNGGAILFGAEVGSGALPQTAIKSLLTNGASNGVADLAFSTRAAAANTALTEKMRLTSAGNLGIGVTAPQAALEVASGRIRATGLGANPTTGVGIEFGYTTGLGFLVCYDHDAATYKQIELDGSTLLLNPNSAGKISYGFSGASAGFEGLTLNPTLSFNNPAFNPGGANLVRTAFGVAAVYDANAAITGDGNLGYAGAFSTTITSGATLAAAAFGLQANLYTQQPNWSEQGAFITVLGVDTGTHPTTGGGAGYWNLMRAGMGSATGDNTVHGIRITAETDANVHPGIGVIITASQATNAYRTGFMSCASTTYGFIVGSDGVNTAGTGDPTTPYAYVSRATGTALFFVDSGGACHATSFPVVSDRRTKSDIADLDAGSLDLIMQLRPVSYVSKFTPDRRSAGFIAQDLMPVMPEAVVHDKENDAYMREDGAILAHLVRAVQELRAEVAALKAAQ